MALQVGSVQTLQAPQHRHLFGISSPAPQRAPDLRGIELLGVAGVAAAYRGRNGKSLTRRRYSAETTRVIGDWADGAVEAGEVELVVSELEGGIVQFRSVHAEGSSRYGEEFDLQAGSTENLYLIKASDRPWLLIGAFSQDSKGLLSQMLETETGMADKIGTMMLQFFDGGQVSFIEDLVQQRSGDALLIYTSTPAMLALKKNLSEEALGKVSFVPIKNSSRLTIEEGREMRFVLTPTNKLPEALSAFDPLTGSLFTGKFFSAHRAIGKNDKALDSPGVEGWESFVEDGRCGTLVLVRDWYHLFDCYFFTQSAASGVRKIFSLCEALRGPDVSQLAPLHGPVVKEQCWKLMAKYEAWTEQKLRKETRRNFKVLVMYASAYGHTKTLAHHISKGLAKSGTVTVEDMNLEHCTAEDVAKALETADGFCIGSPTLGGEMPSQVKEALGVILNLPKDRRVPCGVFGSFGWSGEAVDELQFRLKDSGFPVAFDPIRCKFRPTEETLKLCRGYGVRLFQKLCRDVLQKRKKLARNLATVTVRPGSGALEAFGKMRTSQAVMTSLADGEDVITPVSWVNQASFEPLGLTLAIPKPQKKTQEVSEPEDLSFRLDEILKNHPSVRTRYLEGDEVREILEELMGESKSDKRLDKAHTFFVAEDTSTIRSLDWDRDRFDIEFRLERGTTYNSYIIKGTEKVALVDTSHEKFQDLYTAALKKELDFSSLDYLIVSHTEPDHSGLIGKVLEMAAEAGNEKLEIIGSKMCIAYLENLVFVPFKSRIVKNGDQVDLGGGHNLEFVIAPNLHWPDTMFTFDHKTGVLFTCDAFGMHYCSEHPEDVEGVKDLLPHYATYYDCLMKPNARSVLTALGKIGHFDLKVRIDVRIVSKDSLRSSGT
eukprot:Skav211308  [mRNA]  locus=scaffold3605:34076:39426:+ [translate_table: standard]